MPSLETVFSARNAFEADIAGAVGFAEPAGIDYMDIGHHLVVDIAAEDRRAGLVEQHRFGWHAGIDLDVECLGGRERINMVAYRVIVGKGDFGSG